MDRRNHLVNRLPQDVRDRLAREFEYVSLAHGKVLHRPNDLIEHLYFPLDCVISVTMTMGEGRTVEIGAIGSREVVGINAFMGRRESTKTEYIVQVQGDALKIASKPLLDAFDENKGVRDVLLKYTQAMIAEISQNTACNRLHEANQRYARWLLEVRDRVHRDEFPLTHEFMSQMLGVRRATVTVIANELQARGIIRLERGTTHIADVDGLKKTACECYDVLQDEYNRLLGARATQ
jgi:CRP-like cAMP-binding protein